MSALVIGLVAGLAVAAVVIVCCIRSVCKEKSAIERQVKQVHQVDEDVSYDDVEAPTPPSEQHSRQPSRTTAATAAAKSSKGSEPTAKKTAKARARAPAPAHDGPPSYDDLQEHVYGDDAEEFQGRHEYQSPDDPYDAPVRVSRSTERRSGSHERKLSREEGSKVPKSSSRGRSAVAGRVVA